MKKELIDIAKDESLEERTLKRVRALEGTGVCEWCFGNAYPCRLCSVDIKNNELEMKTIAVSSFVKFIVFPIVVLIVLYVIYTMVWWMFVLVKIDGSSKELIDILRTYLGA